MNKKVAASFKFSHTILATHRMLLGYTKTKMAKLIGVSKQAYNEWEIGRFQPNSKYINRIAKIVNTKPQRLLLLDFVERKSKFHAK